MSNPVLQSESFESAAYSLRNAIQNERASSTIAEAAEVMRRAAESFQESVSKLAHIEGMKSENMQRQHRGEAMAYTEKDFF